VLVASADALPALQERASHAEGELIAFSDADALRALETITSRKPAVIALERVFAGTPRGAALINRIKADPTLKHSEIRVVAEDSDFGRPAPRPGGSAGPSTPAGAAAAVAAAPAKARAQPLDQRGTRRAPRFKIAGLLEIVVDGNPATLVDISTVGAQVISTAGLKPNQRFRIGLIDEQGDIRLRASVAWAAFEITSDGPRYRAGVQFLDSNPGLEGFIARHRQS
jgi:hypothetical protein